MLKWSSRFLRCALLSLSILLPLAELSAVAGPSQTAPHVSGRLVSEVSGITPGQSFWLGVELEMEEGWHVYWTNPGESGLPTEVTWDLPEGFTVGELRYPTPTTYLFGGLMSYVYEGKVLLMAPVTTPRDLKPDQVLTFGATADWLVCKDICLPGSATLALNLPVLETPVEPTEPRWADTFDATRAQWPITDPAEVSVEVEAMRQGEQLALLLTLPDALALTPDDLYFFPKGEVVDPAAAQGARLLTDGRLLLTTKVSHYAPASPTELQGVLRLETGWTEGRPGLAFAVPLADGDIHALLAASSTASADDGGANLVLILGAAFLGGLILNLMPCVFPVLGLKVMGFVNQAGEDKRTVVAHGLVYSFGVLLSFWVLAGLLIVLRAGGAELGWGFQLQNWGFVFGLAALLLIFGLNLSGVFEIGTSAVGAGSKLTSKGGFGGSFFSGVLATVVATPCAAPFLAPALGAALALPTFSALLAFTAIALGLALPYLLLSIFPQASAALPKPGPWMETFKQAMAFPLYATVGYLLWTLAGLVEEAQFLNTLLALVLMSLSAWLYGRYAHFGAKKGKLWFGRLSAAAMLLLGIWLAAADSSDPRIEWEDWSPERVAELRADGRTIYIDFTARWCVTCQVNKNVVFSSEQVIRAFDEADIALLKADWTDKNETIARALRGYRREAVPLNLMYFPGEEEPLYLPELLTPRMVLNALER